MALAVVEQAGVGIQAGETNQSSGHPHELHSSLSSTSWTVGERDAANQSRSDVHPTLAAERRLFTACA
jgi:hypothetical protein